MLVLKISFFSSTKAIINNIDKTLKSFVYIYTKWLKKHAYHGVIQKIEFLEFLNTL